LFRSTIPGIIMKIVDPETLIEKKEGESGEIILRGPTITEGYFNGVEHTEKALVQLPGADEAYLRTGDIGLVINEELFVTGRIKDTIIIRGVQYQAEDLEYVASTCHAQLSPSGTAAFSVDQGDGEKLVLVQEVKKEKWDNCDREELNTKIKDAIFSAFGLSIHDLILVPQGPIPKTTSGKVRRQASRVQYEQQRFRNV
ncbi:MAG: AMP-binding protein, partial [Cyclobacteriaceae bacterium]